MKGHVFFALDGFDRLPVSGGGEIARHKEREFDDRLRILTCAS